MMHTMLWKEYREHRLIWLTMLLVNCGVLIGLWQLDQTFSLTAGQSKLLMLGPVAALFVWGYGMICGAMLLAGEREEGTLNFLDTLPVSRLRLWLVKGQIGLLLLFGQIIVLWVFLAVLRAREDPNLLVDASQSLWPYALGMLALGLIGMAAGLFFSARGENVLHTIGLAVVGQIVAWIAAVFLGIILSIFVLILVEWLVEGRNPGPILRSIIEGPITIFSVFGGLTLAAIVGSARIFSRADRERRPVAVRRMRAGASVVASCLRIIWLCYRQMGRLALGVLVFSLFLGVLFLLTGPLLWPAATLCLGVLCGVTVFSDEQTLGSFRFLGDQRFPLGRIWVIKSGLRFALLLLSAFLILLPSLLVGFYYGMTKRAEPPLIHEMPFLVLIAEVVPWPTFLLMWLLYGFCAGQLCGLLSRKSIVAAMIAFMISALLVTLWVPSLAGIGLHFWQIAGPPLILLAAAAFLVPAWTADRLAEWKTYLGISGAMAASLGWIAFGIWYRVIEVPDVPEPFDVAAYTASIPTADENEAGQLIRSFWGKVDPVMSELRKSLGKKQPLSHELSNVLSDGWPDRPSELGDWMDKVFAEDWLQPLTALPDLPPGTVVDPRLLTLRDLDGENFRKWNSAGSLSMLLAARGLQQQARGDPAVFVQHLRIALALSRTLRHHMPILMFHIDDGVATLWPKAVDLWLRKLRGRPDLLRRALQTLLDYEAQLPDDEGPFRATYLVVRNTLRGAPEQLLNRVLKDGGHHNEAHRHREAELQTVVLLWLIPWEQERHERLLRLAFRRNDRDLRKIDKWGGDVFASLLLFEQRLDIVTRAFSTQRNLVDLRACQLKVALRLYQEENGDLPADLDALVPRYLKSLPRDPFGGQPFHYRRSRGEWIAWLGNSSLLGQPPGTAEVPPGEKVPLMPRTDGPVAPPARAEAMPHEHRDAQDRGVLEEQWLPPPEGVPFMPHMDEPMRPPLPVPQPGGPPPLVILATRFVPQGQGILWSVGEDGHDDGGKEQSVFLNPSSLGQDLIYLVPPPP
jgi:hypothetical protein